MKYRSSDSHVNLFSTAHRNTVKQTKHQTICLSDKMHLAMQELLTKQTP